eukprot:TRINITY_DN504_c0_g2_i1.p1 TRINITY_DN504_c0_g2~~TRINITY_DN504_c0_g2_i1.p1  ORF type:complete len:853 (-),score=207.33 TRINITY_DN504_c0_g2_i1:2591-5149(-)
MSVKQHIVDTVPNDKDFKNQLEFQNAMRTLLKSSKKFAEMSNHVISSSDDSFSSQLSDLAQRSWISSPSNNLSNALFHYGTTLASLENLNSQMGLLFASSFFDPVTSFIDYDFQEVTELKTRRDNAISDYESMLTKIDDYLKKGKVDDNKLRTFERELDSLKKSVVSLDAEFGKKLDHLESKKEFKLLRYIYQHMELQSIFFQTGNKLFSDLIKKMEPIKEHIDTLDHTSPNRYIIEGYLSKKSAKLGRGWAKWWFVLRNGYLYYHKKNADFDSTRHAINTLLCTVRVGGSTAMAPLSKKKDTKSKAKDEDAGEWTFEIIMSDTSRKPILLQAETEEDRDRWVKAFQDSISNSLNSQTIQSSHGSSGDSDDRSASDSGDSEDVSDQYDAQQVMRVLHRVPGNMTCADCDASMPDWASINLGALLCLECSGVHRSLGVHITKVRSLTLDRLDTDLLMFMKRVGNTKLNTIYEQALRESRPSKSSDRETRERFIRAKYVTKSFLAPPPSSSDPSEYLHHHVNTTKDVPVTILHLLACGADINSPGSDKGTPLHAAVSSNKLVYVACLLQNGANLSAVDDVRGWTPLHYAAFYDRPHIARCLLKYDSSKSKKADKDAIGKVPLEVATEFGSTHTEQILRGGRDNYVTMMSVEDLENDREEAVLAPFSKAGTPQPLPPKRKVPRGSSLMIGARTPQSSDSEASPPLSGPRITPRSPAFNQIKKSLPEKPLPSAPEKPLPAAPVRRDSEVFSQPSPTPSPVASPALSSKAPAIPSRTGPAHTRNTSDMGVRVLPSMPPPPPRSDSGEYTVQVFDAPPPSSSSSSSSTSPPAGPAPPATPNRGLPTPPLRRKPSSSAL